MSDALARLAEEGVSLWIDDLSREAIESGELQRKVDELHVAGVTTNPTIFASALADGETYDEQVRELAAAGADVEEAVFQLTVEDVRRACDVMAPVHQRSDGLDGQVSLEVDPRLARDTQGTVEAAKRIYDAVDRPNLLVKVPATVEGLPAITEAVASGINVNVTLIFSLDRYRAVMNAYALGLERAKESGRDLRGTASVASFFVSRVDSEVDKRLDAVGTDEAKGLKGKAAISNARLAYAAYEEFVSTSRWQVLADVGARPQRPLWASTGVKDPSLPDTLYVTELVAPGTVNTMPEKTLLAVADHGEVSGDTVRGRAEEAQQVLDAIERLGISYTEVTEQLEREGVQKFVDSWEELLETVRGQLEKAGGGA